MPSERNATRSECRSCTAALAQTAGWRKDRHRRPKDQDKQQDVGRAFNSAGLPAVFERDMLLWLRCHVPMCIAFESVSVAGKRRDAGASWSEALTIAQRMQEGFTLIQRLGYRLYPASKARLHATPAWVPASMLWFISHISSFRELLVTGINECRALVDVLVSAAQEAKPTLSVSRIEAMKPTQR